MRNFITLIMKMEIFRDNASNRLVFSHVKFGFKCNLESKERKKGEEKI